MTANTELRHFMARVARKIPFYVTLRKSMSSSKSASFDNSRNYWEERYKSGGNSGEGSYGKLAQYKAEFLNQFSSDRNLTTVFELGCGDGNQLAKLDFAEYVGVDISEICLEKCRAVTKNDSFNFYNPEDFDQSFSKNSFDLALSLDVIYHLVEDEAYYQYIDRLFGYAQKYVIVYSSDFEEFDPALPHVKHRAFTKDVAKLFPDWDLEKVHENPFAKDHKSTDYGSFAKFHVFYKPSN